MKEAKRMLINNLLKNKISTNHRLKEPFMVLLTLSLTEKKKFIIVSQQKLHKIFCKTTLIIQKEN
jgi:hypothetical protein